MTQETGGWGRSEMKEAAEAECTATHPPPGWPDLASLHLPCNRTFGFYLASFLSLRITYDFRTFSYFFLALNLPSNRGNERWPIFPQTARVDLALSVWISRDCSANLEGQAGQTKLASPIRQMATGVALPNSWQDTKSSKWIDSPPRHFPRCFWSSPVHAYVPSLNSIAGYRNTTRTDLST